MEIPEGERVVVAKPVASRPNCSTFKSFSELLAGAINASSSPPTSDNNNAVAAIRPKTVRFKPPPNPSSSKGENIVNSGTRNEPTPTPTVVYKPLAKLVSKTTVSLLANMGNSICDHSKGGEEGNKDSRSCPQNIPKEKEDVLPPTAAGVDRPSYDGYNWRKYGQKQVKGSEYPRSYYKCTHPNCPVKKKVERSFDGQIAEIVYKGEHNHSKPHPPKARTNNNVNATTTTTPHHHHHHDHDHAWNENELAASHDQLAYQGNALVAYDPIVNGVTINDSTASADNNGTNKRRKTTTTTENQGNNNNNNNIEGVGEGEARIVVQSCNDTEMIGDGFRWRKYGQKVVKGNPYPRSYYRCTSVKCNVRKHVERASEDPKAFITTYEGKHNHDMPLRTTTADSPKDKDKL